VNPSEDDAATTLMFTVNPGLEDIVRDEFGERIAAAGCTAADPAWPDSPAAGRVPVAIAAPPAVVRATALAMRSVHHVTRHVTTFELPPAGALDAIRRRLAELDVPGLDSRTPFRVSGVRCGTHDFTSQDAQGAAGAGIQARHGAPVDLRHYTVNVHLDIFERTAIVGVAWTERPLSRRFARPFQRRVALSANVAYAMLRLATGGLPPARLLDPFCGTGTILLEGGSLFPTTELHGSDRDRRAVAGAADNLAAAGLHERTRLITADAREPMAHADWAGGFDSIVTNPPFGRRLGRGIDFRRFYAACLASARGWIAPDGRLVILAVRRGAFNAARQHNGQWHIEHARVIELGGIYPGVFVLSPR